MPELEQDKPPTLDDGQLILQTEAIEFRIFKERLARVQNPEAKKDKNEGITQSQATAQSKMKMPTRDLAAGQS